jgi:hypothetical protein
MESFEKLGFFYLGKLFDAQRQERTEDTCSTNPVTWSLMRSVWG